MRLVCSSSSKWEISAEMIPTPVSVFRTCFIIVICAQLSVSTDQKNITAESGQNVTLTCQAPNKNIPVIAVEWSRADLDPEYVLLYRDDQFDPEQQHRSFKNRVDLQDRQMKDGDVSLILKDVTTADAGTYECHIIQRGTNRRKRAVYDTEPIKIISLRVDPPPGPSGGLSRGRPGLIVSLSVPAVLIAAAVFVWIYRKPKQQSQNSYQPHSELQPV